MNFKKNNIINVFVSIAPSHNKNFEEIISAGLTSGSNILINAGDYICNNSLWDMIIRGDRSIGNKSGSSFTKIKFQVSKLRSYKKTINKVKNSLPKARFNLYYCNLEDVLNNYMFFSFRKNLINERILVEDGILNYYDYKISPQNKKTFKTKKIISFLTGIPYVILKGQLSGIDLDIVKKQYVKSPLKAIYPEKSLELPQKKIIYKPLKNIILFIGQDILENILGKEKYLLEVESILIEIKKEFKKESILIYKPHRNGDYKSILSLLDKYFKQNYELILDNTPIERLVSEIKPILIYSFYSTALLNIQMALPEKTDVIIFSKPTESVDQKVLDMFKEVGIKLLR